MLPQRKSFLRARLYAVVSRICIELRISVKLKLKFLSKNFCRISAVSFLLCRYQGIPKDRYPLLNSRLIRNVITHWLSLPSILPIILGPLYGENSRSDFKDWRFFSLSQYAYLLPWFLHQTKRSLCSRKTQCFGY